MSVTTTQLVELYLAYFGRPPDVAGLNFYTTGNFELADVARSFSASAESTALYGAAFGTGQINAIYQNLFNRDAEPAGDLYWQGEVSSGRISPAQAALAILQGAQNSDRASVQNKALVAGAFLAQLDTDAEIAGYAGANAAARARTFLKTVDATAASLDTAQAALPAQVMQATGLAPPFPPASPPPAFAVTKDGGNIVSFAAPGTQIAASEAGGTWTFTSSGGITGSGTVTGPVAGVLVPAATTLSIGSALASGKAFTGAGTALVVANAAGEDLTAFTATGVTGIQLTSGQNYTLTTAQAAIGRIGAGGTAGAVTDAGTLTVKDTLSALGGGVANTLKTNGADSVIATAATGADISATTVAGIDSIVLASGQTYTMTAAQAALADGTAGTQAVTLTTLASGVLAATVESFALGNFANTVTLGAAAQNVSSPAGSASTLTIGASTATGTWALAHGGDVLVATAGANIAGVNAGAATTAENLTLTGAITMTQAQHEALAITAAGGSDAVTITTAGAVTARAGVESYTVSAGGANNLAVNAGATAITGTAANITAVSVGANSVSGTWALGNGADRIVAAAGANIAGVNSGAATSAENLDLTGAITMTQAQHEALSIAAAGGSDAVAITTGGAVTGKSGVESYTVSAGGANTLAVLAGATAISGAAGHATTVTVAGNTVSGTWALGNGADAITATHGASIAGVNGGAATTAQTLGITGTVSMTLAQHEAMAITVASSADVVKVTTGGTVTAKSTVSAYNVSSVASNTLTVNAGRLDVGVTGAAGFASTVDAGGSALTGTWNLAHVTADAIKAANGAVLSGINSGGATTAELLEITGGGTVTMTAAQHNALAITAAGTETVVIAGGGTLTAQNSIETYKVQGGTSSLTLTAGATGVNLTGVNDGFGAATITIGALAVNGTWSLAGSPDRIIATDGADISGVNAGAATTAENLTLTGGISMTLAQHAGLTVTAGGGSDKITVTNGGAIAAQAGVETYTVAGAASNVTVNGAATGLAVNGSAGFATTVTVGGNTVTGTYALAHGADRIVATTGANISGATTTTVETLTMTGDLTMTQVQYGTFNTGGITAAGGSDRIILTAALTGSEVLNAAVESFTLAVGNNAVTLGGASQSINAQALSAGQALTLGGAFAATVTLAAGNLAGSSAGGGVTVTAGTDGNTLTTGAGDDNVNAGDGADNITGGAGVDSLNGENGNDRFFYAAMADFVAGNAVVDLINGGADTDTVEITGAVTLAAADSLTRMTNVEQITTRFQTATQLAHSVVVTSNALLGGVTTIDLSNDGQGASTATLNFTGVTTALTLKGVSAGSSTITGGSGADTLVGGTGNDLFIFGSAAAAATDTAITGGGGNDTVLFRSTAGETLVVGDKFSAGLSYLVTTNGTAGASAGTTSENINASTHTRGSVTLTGNGGNNLLTGSAAADTLVGGGGTDTVRGGGGNDTITTAASGVTTYVFENTASANGLDNLTGVRSGGTFDFSGFLGKGGAMLATLADATVPTVALNLASGQNIGVRYASSSLSSTDIRLAADNGVAGEVVVADNGKVVVFSFSSASTSNSANGSIYYVQDVDTGAGQIWQVMLIGTMSDSSASILQIVNSGVYL